MPTPPELADILIRHFRAQTARYEALLELSHDQLLPIRERNSAALMEILARKQDILRAVDEADTEAYGTVDAWQEIRQTVPPAIRAPVLEAYGTLRATLKAVIDLEEESRTALSHSPQDLISRMQKGKQLNKAYGAPPPPAGRLTDRKN